MNGIDHLLSLLFSNELRSRESVYLTPSENVLSPLAKLPFLLDAHHRYFLDDFRRFGKWYFPGGKQFENIEHDILAPLLKELSGASYVNVRPISGMSCMTIALAALAEKGNCIMSIPVENGGHVSTSIVAERLGLRLHYIPFSTTYDIDLDRMKSMLLEEQPALIYIDQSTLLFPLDPFFIRQLVDAVSSKTIIYYDSSHTNGLIIGKAMFNPLKRGAHVMGGSTHKTLPGPHKGFLATNEKSISERINHYANHFVSHHHPSNMLSLLITLIEMKFCDGEVYAKKNILNAKTFARELRMSGFEVAAEERGYTDSHQVWAYLEDKTLMQSFLDRLYAVGLVVNYFDSLPGIAQPAMRLSLSELTRCGADDDVAKRLAQIMSRILKRKVIDNELKEQVEVIKQQYSSPQYCFQLNDIEIKGISESPIKFFNDLILMLFKY